LQALDPLRVLERGYALVGDAATGALISSVREVRAGQELQIALRDGSVTARVSDDSASTRNE
jgi:exonuclease VII large subunit